MSTWKLLVGHNKTPSFFCFVNKCWNRFFVEIFKQILLHNSKKQNRENKWKDYFFLKFDNSNSREIELESILRQPNKIFKHLHLSTTTCVGFDRWLISRQNFRLKVFKLLNTWNYIDFKEIILKKKISSREFSYPIIESKSKAKRFIFRVILLKSCNKWG